MVEHRLNVVGACERIVVEAERLAGQNYAYNMGRKNGALDFITSPENGGVDASLISYQQGRKLASLHIYYDQRTKPCQASQNCDTNVCDTGSTPVRKETDVTISNCLTTPVREYTAADMNVLCNDTEEFMRSRMLNDLRATRELLSERILADILLQVGVNVAHDGTTIPAGAFKTLQLLATVSGQQVPLPGNFVDMVLDYQNNQFVGVPAVIGQGHFEKFAKLHNMSCCNATTPYGDANIDGDVRWYKDQAANNVLGANQVIMAAYGAVHLLTFNENTNIMATGVNAPDAFHTVIPDPGGYPFDWNFDFYFDHCDKKWKSMLSVLWGTFNVFQADSFAASGEDTSPDTSPDCNDELDGVLGIWGYNITNA